MHHFVSDEFFICLKKLRESLTCSPILTGSDGMMIVLSFLPTY